MRLIFFIVMFAVSIPLFLKKSMGSLQIINFLYLMSILVMIFSITLELPFFKIVFSELKIETDSYLFKNFNENWIENFFGLMIGFYIQPFLFSLRQELQHPTLKRSKKVSQISTSFILILNVIIGCFGYWVLGDVYTQEIFILRKPYPNKNYVSELFIKLLIIIFFILNTLSLAMYNSTIREYLGNFYDVNKNRKTYIFYSLFPFLLICIFSFVYPNIIKVLNLFGYTVCNFNGYIIPFMMKIQLEMRKKEDNVIKLIFLCFGLALFVIGGLVALIVSFS